MGSANDFCGPQYWPEDGQTSADSQEFCRAYLQLTSVQARLAGYGPSLHTSNAMALIRGSLFHRGNSSPNHPVAQCTYLPAIAVPTIKEIPTIWTIRPILIRNYIPIRPSKAVRRAPPPPKPPPSPPPSPPPPPPIPDGCTQTALGSRAFEIFAMDSSQDHCPHFLVGTHTNAGGQQWTKLVPMVIGKTVRFSANRNAETTSTSTLISRFACPIL